jgi:hypothetical protein
MQNTLLQNKSIAHLCLLPMIDLHLTFLCHFSIRTTYLLLFAVFWCCAQTAEQNKTGLPIICLTEVCELVPNIFFVPPVSRGYLEVGKWYHIVQKGVCRGVALQYDTLFLGKEKSGMKSNPLVQRNK